MFEDIELTVDVYGFDLSNDHSLLYSVEATASGILRLRRYDYARFRSRKSVALQDAAQPIFADCILRGRRKSTTGKKRERKGKDTEDKGAHGCGGGGGIRGGGREMPINESARSAKSWLAVRRSSRTTKTTSARGRSEGERIRSRAGGVTHLP